MLGCSSTSPKKNQFWILEINIILVLEKMKNLNF